MAFSGPGNLKGFTYELPSATLPDATETSDPKTGAGFFQIDGRVWAAVTAGDINLAASYLVLACGTGHGNRSTSWSTKAVMNHAGVGWIRAKAAIDDLIARGFVRYAEKHTPDKPRYELATYREFANHVAVKNPPAPPDYYDEKVLEKLQAGKQPTHKFDRKHAERLCQRGLLCRDAQGVYKFPEPQEEDSGDDPVWLPNSIVLGTAAGEDSPVRKLRSAGCIWTLRLFVDLYSAQNLRDDGGIDPRLIRQKFDRQNIGEQGAYIVWGFKPGDRTHWWEGPFAAHRSRPKVKPEDSSPAWESLNLLKTMGLVSFVPHIFENDTNAAEPIHVYGLGSTAEDPLEQEIGAAADRAARAMCLPSRLETAADDGFEHFCPVLRTKPSAQMVGVARLTYRPDTKRTAAWQAQLHQAAPVWLETFEKLADKGKIADFLRKENYA
jgi:hypothetical protein